MIYNGMDYYIKLKNLNSTCNKIYSCESMGKLLFKERIYAEDPEFNSRAFFFFENVSALKIVFSNFVQTTGSIIRSKIKEI